MSTRRLSIALLILAATGAATANDANACCWTDWLFGRTASPYAAGYAPYGTPYSAGYAPTQILTTPIGTTPYAANYASGYTALPLTPPAMSSGAFQVQRPTYLDNPSVYTGMPVAANAQAAYSVPVTSGYRGVANASGYYGASNQYPSTTITSSYSGSPYGASPYAANYPSSTMLPTTPVAPLFPNAPAQPVGGGLSRFFGSLFGTNYNSSYYRAPVTYYRPVTSVDPMLGTTVTVQQPCTSTIQQVQRTPYSSFQPGQAVPVYGQAAPVYGQPATDCQTQGGVYGTPAYSQQVQPYGQSYESPYGAPVGGVGQASAMNTSPSQFTVPIPSTAPPTGGGYYGQPNTSPLTGSPTAPRSQTGSGDLVPLEQPRLDAYRATETQPRSIDNNYNNNYTPPAPIEAPAPTPPTESPPKSYWQLQDAEDSTAMVRPEPMRDPISLSVPSFTAAEPIRAPEFEPSPFDLRDRVPATSTGTERSNFDAPQLPPASLFGPADANSASNRTAWSGTPVREAALVREQPVRRVEPSRELQPKPAPVQPKPVPARDSRWFTIQ